jgi:hypothetical protein
MSSLTIPRRAPKPEQRRRKHPPYVPGAWAAEQEARMARGESPHTTPPPRERKK